MRSLGLFVAGVCVAAGCFVWASRLHEQALQLMTQSSLDLDPSPRRKFFAVDPRAMAERPANRTLADMACDLEQQGMLLRVIGCFALTAPFWPRAAKVILARFRGVSTVEQEEVKYGQANGSSRDFDCGHRGRVFDSADAGDAEDPSSSLVVVSKIIRPDGTDTDALDEGQRSSAS